MSAIAVDIIVFVILLISAIIAFYRGFIKEVLTILALAGAGIAAYVVGGRFYPMALNVVGPAETEDGPRKLFGFVPVELAADILAYGGVFLTVFIILAVITHMISNSAEGIGLGPLDRSLGIVFGLARGVLLVALLYLPFSMMLEKDELPDWLTQARTMAVVKTTADGIRGFMSKDVADGVEAVQDKRKESDSLQNLVKETKKTDLPKETGYKQDARDDLQSLIEQEQ